MGIATFERHEEECESQEEANLRIAKINKIVEDTQDIEALKEYCVGGHVKGKDVKEELKKGKSKEEEVERKAHVEREEENESTDSLSESDWDWDSSDDESEDEHGE